MITQTTAHDSPGTISFSDAEDLDKTQAEPPSAEAPNAGVVD